MQDEPSPPRLHGCTIVTRAYAPFARVLGESFLRFHEDANFTVLVLDGPSSTDIPTGKIGWIGLAEIGLTADELRQLPVVCAAEELAVAVKPRLLHRLSEADELVFYFAPETEIFGSLRAILDYAREQPILIAPSSGGAGTAGAGVFDRNFLRLLSGSRPFLTRWWAHLREICFQDPAKLPKVEQQWFDAIPAAYSAYAVLQDPTCNVGPEDLANHKLEYVRNGYIIDGAPLRFFRFAGYDPTQPHLLSTTDALHPRVKLSECAVAARLCAEYRAKLLEAGFEEANQVDYGFAALENGVRLDPAIRQLYLAAIKAAQSGGAAAPPDPFADGADRFGAWLNEPLRESPLITRYMMAIHAARPDVRENYPEVLGEDAREFADWFREYGAAEENTPEPLLPPGPPEDTGKTAGTQPTTSRINVIGYFDAEVGVGEAARLLVDALAASGVEHDTFSYRDTASRQQHPFAQQMADEPRGDISIICINADQVPRFARRRGSDFLRQRYTIGVWFWEVDDFPSSFHRAFDFVDEVWVASTFLRDNLARISPRPVFQFDLPITAPPIDPALTRADVGLPEDRFAFHFSFDFLSVAERKNPFALIDAFSRAFRAGEGPVLLIKTINGAQRVAELERLRFAAAAHPDVIVRDGYLSAVEKNTLIARCDCYVSLHRSEGFGLTLSEAMAVGRPVIATAYSGNMTFMTPENSWLCSYRLQQVGPHAPPYPPGAHWAAVDIAEAAGLLRYVYEHPEEARIRAERALRDIEQFHSPAAAGAKARARIDEIRQKLARGEITIGSHQPAEEEAAAQVRTLQQQLAQARLSISRARARAHVAESELATTEAELERREREVWDQKVRRADALARLRERDEALNAIRESAVWRTVRPLWRVQDHFRRAAHEDAVSDDELLFALDTPADWTTSREVVLIKGWCFLRSGKELAGVRAKIGKKGRFARYGLPREDLSDDFADFPLALRSGFTVELQVPVGTSTVRLEAISHGGRWEKFFEHTLTRTAADGAESPNGATEISDRLPTSRVRDSAPLLLPKLRPEQLIRRLEPLFTKHAMRIEEVRPRFSVITPTFKTKPQWLAEAAASLLQQTSAEWEWCIVDDGSDDGQLRTMLNGFATLNDRVRVQFSANGGISSATNQALDLASGEFVCFLDHDDLLHPQALELMTATLNEGYEAVYSDEDKLDDTTGRLIEPFLKPDWSPEYFRGAMYVGHLLCLRRDLAARVRFDSAFDGVQDFEFMLRVSETGAKIGHVPELLYHWRKTSGSIAENAEAKPEAAALQERAVNAHLARVGLPARAKASALPHRLQIIPLPRQSHPPISVIIPTKDAPELLGRCLESIASKTSYPEFEVILIDNDSSDEEARQLMRDYPVRVVPFPGQFNFSRANNLGAEAAGGEFLLFLNNDTEIQSSDWLEHLLYYAEQNDVGAAGALLVYPDRTVQHAGVALGMRGTADHLMRGFPLEVDGYAGSLACAREVSAVTAACMMIRKSLFLEIGRFNEHFFTAYQDVDLCLRLRARGLRIIYTPRTVVVHHESVSRKRYYDMVDRMLLLDQWEQAIERGDPYYNRRLNLERGDYTLVA